jgi:arsenate reductase
VAGLAVKPIVLAYSGCSTCRKALAWLESHDITSTERAIVDEPPTLLELARWVPASGLPLKKWLNTSGLSYRALGKAKVDAASDETLMRWLSADGKLVKRPVLVAGKHVLVGFNPAAYAAVFTSK